MPSSLVTVVEGGDVAREKSLEYVGEGDSSDFYRHMKMISHQAVGEKRVGGLVLYVRKSG